MATNTTCTVSLLPFGYVVTPGTSSFVGSLWLDARSNETSARTLPHGYSRQTHLLDDCGNVDVIGLQFRY